MDTNQIPDKEESMIRELIYLGFASAAGAFRLYPDNKHTFADSSDYLMKEGKKVYEKFASARYHQSPVWVKASERLPNRPGENERQCEVFIRNIKTGQKKMIWWGPVPQKGGNRKSLLFHEPNDWEWLSESPSPQSGSESDLQFWKSISEKCIAEHPRIVEGL